MANNLSFKVWNLDTTAGLVQASSVQIAAIRLTFTTVGAGSCVLSTLSTAETILDVKTSAASTAAAFQLTQEFLMDGEVFSGLRKVTMVNVDTIYVQTK